MRLKINSKKHQKKCVISLRVRKKAVLLHPLSKGSPAASRVLDKKPCWEFGEEKNPPYLCRRFPLSSGHAVFEMFWMDKRSSV